MCALGGAHKLLQRSHGCTINQLNCASPVIGVNRAQFAPGLDGSQSLFRVSLGGKLSHFIKREGISVNRATALARANEPSFCFEYASRTAIVADVRGYRIGWMELPLAGQRF